MNEQQLSDLLRNLPREEASADFTDRVLERVERPARRSSRHLWAIAASLCLLAIAFFAAREWQHRHEKQETLAQLEALRAEHTALERELERLHQLREGRPVIYLGGDDKIDVVLDLERYRQHQSLRARPASFSNL